MWTASTESSAPARCCFANLFLRSRCKAWSCQGAERASGGDLRARFAALFKTRKLTAREARSTKVLVLGVRSRQLGQVLRVTRMQKLSTAQEGIHKAPCAWRTPPPSRGRSPYYPYAKVISGANSGPPCTPPHPGQAPLLPVCKSYQRRKQRPAVYPPPSGAGPAITRMQKLSAVHKATPGAKWCRL